LLYHGEKDVKVKNQWGVEMRDALTSMGMNVDFNSYPDLEHWFNDIEMRDVVTFLKSRWEGLDT
jgi:dipeptidyl aminopeptidase/acylaminoacyl peptidase